ncbi:hypothetical protein PLICRDRAFT_116157 [Plicaturopsis crispa FD-325 SS-3]|nr:hypothetical protein PLICRDRAFT_116157 [Plicaturopsis crispa FD-325 SS-3]
MPRRKTELPLDIVVVGGNVGGLAAAYALHTAGHRVRVLEASDGTYRSPGIIQSPPNMTRILSNWGASDALQALSAKTTQWTFWNGESGEKLGLVKLHDELLSAVNGSFYNLKHGDLQDLLIDMVSSTDIKLEFNSRVVDVDATAGAVTLADGTTHSADIIVGADGLHSTVRSAVLGRPSEILLGNDLLLCLSIPTERMDEHEELHSLIADTEVTCWLADGAFFYGNMCGKRDYALMTNAFRHTGAIDDHASWEEIPIDQLDQLHQFAASCEPRLRKLASLGTRAVVKRDQSPKLHFDTWVHDAGKVLFMGEAAHPEMPFGWQSAAMVIEDAATLGGLFSRLRFYKQIPLLLCAYEDIRQPRCEATAVLERGARSTLSIPKGEMQEVRDQAIRATMPLAEADWENADEEYMRQTWGEYWRVFAYDTYEHVEDWWSKWRWADVTERDMPKYPGGVFPTVSILRETIINATL